MTHNEIKEILDNLKPLLNRSPYQYNGGGYCCAFCSSPEPRWQNNRGIGMRYLKFPHEENCKYAQAKRYQLKLIRMMKELSK